MLYREPFMNLFFYYQDVLAYYLYYPAYFFLDEFASAYITITEEMEKPVERFFHYFVIGPISLIIGLLSLPMALVGIVFGSTVESFRRPYVYRTSHTLKSKPPYLKKSYTFCTTNACLGPESICRMNNLRHHKKRARAIGEVLIDENSQTQTYASTLYKEMQANGGAAIRQDSGDKDNYNHDILARFPFLDFVLIQEAFDRQCSKSLMDVLLKKFPYVVHDVTVNSLQSNLHALSSGLAFASKYPILDVDFKFFPDSWSQCWFTSKGLLMVKVLLGKRGDQEFVGYFGNTHLQSYQSDKKILPKQLSNIIDWMKEFRSENTKSNDTVVFEVVGGDFNFDNMSPGDREPASHPIFEKYVDLGRDCPGKDYDWTVGTSLRHVTMWNSVASNPEKMQSALSDPLIRPLYVLNADRWFANVAMHFDLPPLDEHGNCMLSPVGGRRRIDRLIFKDLLLSKPVALNTVTQLAGLTDHLPVTLTLTVDVKNIANTAKAGVED